MGGLWSFLRQRWIIWMLIILAIASTGLYLVGQIHMAATVSKYFEVPFSYSRPEIKSSDVEGVINSGRIKQAIFFSKSLAILGGPKIYLKFYDGKIVWADIVAEDKPAIVLQAKKLNDGYYGDKIVFPSEFIAINAVPFIFFILIIIWSSIRAYRNVKEFGELRLAALKRPRTRFTGVAGIDTAITEMKELVEQIKGARLAKELGYRISKGYLLWGPPGTGKTLLARATAGEAGVPFFAVAGPEFEEKFVGVGASRVRQVFETAKKAARKFGAAVIFVDEVEIAARKRGYAQQHASQEQTASQFFVLMDGVEEAEENVIVIGATNRRDMVDEALLRPGRFSTQIYVGNPDKKGRKSIFGIHAKDMPVSSEVDLEELAILTPGFSGAYIAKLVNVAAKHAWRRCKAIVGRKEIIPDDFLNALKEILRGPARDLDLSETEKKIKSFHEAGHAVVSRMQQTTSNPRMISVISHEQSEGMVWAPPERERHIQFMEEYKETLAYLMAGRVAEEIAFNGAFTPGAAKDREAATKLARQMVYEWSEDQYFGEDLSNLSEGKKNELIHKVDQLLKEAKDKAREILTQPHIRPVFEKIAEHVQVPRQEELEGEELEAFFRDIPGLPVKK